MARYLTNVAKVGKYCDIDCEQDRGEVCQETEAHLQRELLILLFILASMRVFLLYNNEVDRVHFTFHW